MPFNFPWQYFLSQTNEMAETESTISTNSASTTSADELSLPASSDSESSEIIELSTDSDEQTDEFIELERRSIYDSTTSSGNSTPKLVDDTDSDGEIIHMRPLKRHKRRSRRSSATDTFKTDESDSSEIRELCQKCHKRYKCKGKKNKKKLLKSEYERSKNHTMRIQVKKQAKRIEELEKMIKFDNEKAVHYFGGKFLNID